MTFVLLASGFWNYAFGIAMFVSSLFLIMLVLVQRGRGGGLTGALGGMGGQSAFGAKAGDVFTRVTMVTATIWILLCIGAILILGTEDKFGASTTVRSGGPPPQTSTDTGGGDDTPSETPHQEDPEP